MFVFRRVLCRLGFHIRSRKNAKRIEAGWKSICRGCGAPMMKLKGGDWRIMLRPPKAESLREERIRQREAEARHRRTPPPRRKRPDDR